MKRVLLIIACFLFLMQNCMSTSKIAIRATDGIYSPEVIKYDSFWTAMRNIDFYYLKDHHVGDEEQSFAEALKLLIHGNIGDAGDEFRKLYVSSTDPLIREHSKNILIWILRLITLKNLLQ